jgi:hypothetical protein
MIDDPIGIDIGQAFQGEPVPALFLLARFFHSGS